MFQADLASTRLPGADHRAICGLLESDEPRDGFVLQSVSFELGKSIARSPRVPEVTLHVAETDLRAALDYSHYSTSAAQWVARVLARARGDWGT